MAVIKAFTIDIDIVNLMVPRGDCFYSSQDLDEVHDDKYCKGTVLASVHCLTQSGYCRFQDLNNVISRYKCGIE